MSPPTRYQCSVCTEWHEGLPLAYGPEAPIYWYSLTPEERPSRFVLESDYAIFDNDHFFIRGALEIPIVGHEHPFVWVSWASLSRDNFKWFVDSSAASSRDTQSPMFGWLSSQLEGYPPTVNLKVNVYRRAIGQRPAIVVEPTDHPLAVEQRRGITWDRVQEFAQIILHPPGGA